MRMDENFKCLFLKVNNRFHPKGFLCYRFPTSGLPEFTQVIAIVLCRQPIDHGWNLPDLFEVRERP